MFKKIHKICLIKYEIQLIFISEYEFFSIFFFEISIYIYNFKNFFK